jgi:hypothetical protein
MGHTLEFTHLALPCGLQKGPPSADSRILEDKNTYLIGPEPETDRLAVLDREQGDMWYQEMKGEGGAADAPNATA